MKLWIDDTREAPPGWIRAKSVYQAKLYFGGDGSTNLTDISLDHDAGIFSNLAGGDYINFLTWLEEKVKLYGWDVSKINFHIHTMNPVGRANMLAIINKNHWNFKED